MKRYLLLLRPDRKVRPTGSIPYRLSFTTIWSAVLGMTVAAFLGWLFYREIFLSLVIMLAGLAFVPLVQKMIEGRQRRMKLLEFSRMLQSLISALHAGHSLESAFREIERDMKREAWQASNSLLPGLTRLNQRIALGESVEKVLIDTANDWDIEDMKVFAETLSVFRRNGGNLLLHLRRTAELIIGKIETEQDVQVILAKKRTEALMMNIAPYGMIALIIFGSPQYAEPLYSDIGRVIMSIALLLNVTGHVWTYRMLGRNRL